MADEDLSRLRIDKSQTAAHGGRGKKFYRLAVVLAVAVVLAALFFAGVFSPAAEVEVASVSRIYPSQAFTLLNASGYVVAQRKAAVASKITSRLIELNVEEGTRVKEGQVIARLEGEDTAAAVRQAKANVNVAHSSLTQAKAELEDATLLFNRNRKLVDKGYISRMEYDSAEARYKKAVAAVAAAKAGVTASDAALKEAEVSLQYTFIRAPFDGVVLTKNADVGDIVTPLGAAANAKASVVTMADMDSLQVEVDVSESNIEKVKTGQPCEIRLDALPESRFSGKVHMIVPTADRTKATVLVKVAFIERDDRILPEMSAKVAFLERPVAVGEEKPRTVVNPSAVLERDGRKVVFVVKDGRVVETPVDLGAPLGDMMEMLGGVKAGDKVVVNPPPKLRTGAKIKTAEQ